MSYDLEALWRRMNEGPSILFLGQAYLRISTGTDPFLSQVVTKYTAETASADALDYNALLHSTARQDPENALLWMQNLCSRLVIPGWLNDVADVPWSALYTSAIDTVWERALKTPWREIHPIVSELTNPVDPRNRRTLHATSLFGRVDREVEGQRPPLSEREWRRRKQEALALARRLPEIVTPLGIFLIEGYDPECDWLALDDLLASTVDQLGKQQVHWFSQDGGVLNEYAQELIADGTLVVHEIGLATAIIRGIEAGVLRTGLGGAAGSEASGPRIRIGKRQTVVPLSVLNSVSRSAIIIDDHLTATPPLLSGDSRYGEFRRFLSESGTVPVWSGYARGFAYKRHYESELRTKVSSALESRRLSDEPVVLRGQTGTGKTIALGRLAYDVAKEGEYPVLFIEGKLRKPGNSDIAAFCDWVTDEWEHVQQQSGSPPVLIVWDGNDVEQYYGLIQYLSGRGHKAVIVGSSYNYQARKKAVERAHSVSAHPSLDEREAAEFVRFLDSFEASLGQQLIQNLKITAESFLALLYRYLPATRALIRRGIIQEYSEVEYEILKLAQTQQSNEDGSWYENQPLLYALAKAGFDVHPYIFGSNEIEFNSEKITEAKQLMGLVMVPGSLGLRVPFELLVRSIGRDGTRFVTELLEKFDIFQWSEDQVGNLTIGPRQTLEARLWVRANVGGPQYELDYVIRLLSHVRDTNDQYGNVEIQFAVDAVRAIGPNNQDPDFRWAQYYLRLAKCLEELRTTRSIVNPRLMLQEVTLVREHVRSQGRHDQPSLDSSTLLNGAEETIQQALALVGEDPKTRSVFMGELASVRGTKLRHMIETSMSLESVLRQFELTSDAVIHAWSTDTENYYPVDILAWTTQAILDIDELPDEERAKAAAQILYIFDIAEMEDYGEYQAVQFQRRRQTIGQTLGNAQLSENAFQALDNMNSGAGYYLRAHDMLKGAHLDTTFSKTDRPLVERALAFLDENFDRIRHDGSCLYLRFRLWWLLHAGKPWFSGERETLPFSNRDWQYCLQSINGIQAFGTGLNANPRMIYLSGLSAFHLEEYQMAFEIFRELERESDYRTGRSRIIKSYLASTEDGKPHMYEAEVRQVYRDATKGSLYVPQIRREIPFFPREFNRPTIKSGDYISAFHIAFNFLGLTAEPVHFFTNRKA